MLVSEVSQSVTFGITKEFEDNYVLSPETQVSLTNMETAGQQLGCLAAEWAEKTGPSLDDVRAMQLTKAVGTGVVTQLYLERGVVPTGNSLQTFVRGLHEGIDGYRSNPNVNGGDNNV